MTPDRQRDQIRAAMDRLLAGTPLHSNGALTVVSLAVEASVKRHVLTHRHTDLKDEFYARVRAQGQVPASEKELRSNWRAPNSDSPRRARKTGSSRPTSRRRRQAFLVRQAADKIIGLIPQQQRVSRVERVGRDDQHVDLARPRGRVGHRVEHLDMALLRRQVQVPLRAHLPASRHDLGRTVGVHHLRAEHPLCAPPQRVGQDLAAGEDGV